MKILQVASIFQFILTFKHIFAEDLTVKLIQFEDFETFIDENKLVLVKFFAPWCSHCSAMAPEYAAAAEEIHSNTDVLVIDIDASSSQDLLKKHQISRFPTIRFYRNGKAEDYEGGRKKDDFISWINTSIGNPFIQIDDYKNLKYINNTHYILTDYDQIGLAAFTEAAETNRRLGNFYVLTKPNSSTYKIIALRDDEIEFTGSPSETVNFIMNECVPMYGPINAENYAHYVSCNRPLAWFAASRLDYDESYEYMSKVARKIRDDYVTVWVDSEMYKLHAEAHLKVLEYPAFVIMTEDGRYVLENTKEAVKTDKVYKFLELLKEGKLPKALQSEPIPTVNDKAVKQLVGNTFKAEVIDSNVDSFIEIYAEWCGHCKTFEPIYEEFAAKMNEKYGNKLKVFKINGTKNELPYDGFKYTGFPSIFFKKATESIPIPYDEARTLEGLLKFYEIHMTEADQKSEEKQADMSQEL